MTDVPWVFIVDDDPGVRDSLSLLIKSIKLRSRGFDSAAAFLASDAPTHPGCVLLDVRLPGMSGLEMQTELNRRGLPIPVIFLTGHGDMPIAVRAMKAGALDCFAKPFNAQELLDRIGQALSLDSRRRRERDSQSDVAIKVATLSRREREVLDRVVSGMTSQTIAYELGTSKKTIDVQRANMMEKMGAESLADLVHMNLLLQRSVGLQESRH